MTNKQLDLCICEIATGNREALRQLYDEFKNPIFLFDLSILKNYQAAEDVEQDTFLNIMQSACKYRPGTNAFAQVQGDFVQPTIQSDCANNTYESTWVGLGGYNSGKLVQTGTAMNTSGGGRNYYAWYEYLSPSHPNPEIRFSKVTIRPGDRIHTYCSFQRANNKFNAYVANNTNGTSQSVIVNISASEFYDGTTADFINEAPSVGGNTASLTKYGTTNWTNCQVFRTTSTWANLGSLTTESIIMKSKDGNRTLATPSGLSGQTFKSTWNNYS